jgi:hypothetical protein
MNKPILMAYIAFLVATPVFLSAKEPAPNSADSDLSAQLIGCYLFTGNAADSSGNGYNGKVHGPSLTTDRNGDTNSAYKFNGNDNYMLLPVPFDSPQRTVSVWFNARNIDENLQNILSFDKNNLGYGLTALTVQNLGGRDKLVYAAGNANFNTDITEKVWHNAVIVVDKSAAKFFLDGELLSSNLHVTNLHSVNGVEEFVIGSSRVMNGRFFDGMIDDVLLYSRALSDKEVAELYHQ